MNDGDGLLNKAQRKKVRRKQRKQQERQAHRNLDQVTSAAIAEALNLAAQVADAPSVADSNRVIDVELASLSEAEFVRKRVNDALRVGEWLDEISVWIWQAEQHNSEPMSSGGRTSGYELRMDQRVGTQP